MLDALSTYNNQVQICHYKVSYQTDRGDEEQIRKFPTEQEANAFAESNSGTVSAIDTSDCEWMDGMIIPEPLNPMAEAVKIYEMGQAAYEAKCKREAAQKPEQIRADLDYIMLMGGF